MTGNSSRSRIRGTGSAPVSFGCDEIADVTILASPVPAVIALLSAGTVLGIELRAKPEIVVAVHLGTVGGSVVPGNLARLIECLKKGYRFTATVVTLDGGHCRVALRCVGKP